jgi:hypothetical protein
LDLLEVRTTQNRDQAVFTTRDLQSNEMLGLHVGPELIERTHYSIERNGKF